MVPKLVLLFNKDVLLKAPIKTFIVLQKKYPHLINAVFKHSIHQISKKHIMISVNKATQLFSKLIKIRNISILVDKLADATVFIVPLQACCIDSGWALLDPLWEA